MPFFMRITGGVGMHEGYLPGYPASHGCIRMPGKMAENLLSTTSDRCDGLAGASDSVSTRSALTPDSGFSRLTSRRRIR